VVEKSNSEKESVVEMEVAIVRDDKKGIFAGGLTVKSNQGASHLCDDNITLKISELEISPAMVGESIGIKIEIFEKDKLLHNVRWHLGDNKAHYIKLGDDSPDGSFTGFMLTIIPHILVRGKESNEMISNESGQIDSKRDSVAFLRTATRIESQHPIFAGKSITSKEDISTVVNLLEDTKELPEGYAMESKGYVLYFIFQDGQRIDVSVTDSDWSYAKGPDTVYRVWKNKSGNQMDIIRNLFNKKESGQIEPK
jgi:hypothetical protein